MKGLSAGLIFVSLSTVFGLILGIFGHGLSTPVALASLILGGLAAVAAYVQTFDPKSNWRASGPPAVSTESDSPSSWHRYRNIWVWLIGGFFLIFAVRSFCWLLYIDADQLRIQSPNNLGDLALHITYIRNFASGVPFWPDNPIYVFSKLRYPAGIDLFNALLCKVDVDLIRGLVWVALLASIATFYSFLRWGGPFGIAAFLFNGGIVGFQVLKAFQFLDYQGDKIIAWKSIPLTMFVTQRGLLYAIPAGLLLLWHWRETFFRANAAVAGGDDPGPPSESAMAESGLEQEPRPPLPFWIELSLYASMPLFHVHTFLALTVVLVFLFSLELLTQLKIITDLIRKEGLEALRSVITHMPMWSEALGDTRIRKHVVALLTSSLIPATFFVWLVTDHFHAGSVLGWQPGWVQNDGDFAAPFFGIDSKNVGAAIPLVGWLLPKTWNVAVAAFFQFWLANFGAWIPLVLTLFGMSGWKAWQSGWSWGKKLPEDVAFLISATAIFLLAFFVKLAPWGWDNIKVMIWAYFIVLPFLWRDLIAQWSGPVRIAICIMLLFSGFVSLLGGLAAGRPGYGFASRPELDAVGDAVRQLPVEARFAAFPTYNHSLLLQGRRVVMGYPGHLWTQGFDDYGNIHNQLRDLMRGAHNWRATARRLRVRYIFWGREEELNYPMSNRPWERTALRVKSDKSWGAIYDLEPATPSIKP